MSLPFGQRLVTLTLAAGSALLALVLALELLSAGPDAAPRPADEEGASLPDVGPLPAFVPPTFETFDEVLERPLFYAERQLPPAPAQEPATETPREPLQLALEGVAISGESRVALLRDLRSNELVQIAEGNTRDGWTLESVDGDKAIFRRGDDISELAIDASLDRGARTK